MQRGQDIDHNNQRGNSNGQDTDYTHQSSTGRGPFLVTSRATSTSGTAGTEFTIFV